MESWHHAWNIMALFIYLSLIHRHLKYLSLNPKSREFKRMYILYIYWKVICMLWLIPTVWLAGSVHMLNVLIMSKKKNEIFIRTPAFYLNTILWHSIAKSSLMKSPTCSSAVHFWLKVVGLSSFLAFDLFWLSHTL